MVDMRKTAIFLSSFAVLASAAVIPASAQGLTEAGFIRLGAAGAGAGLAASMNHGRVVRRSYESMVAAQAAAAAQTRAIAEWTRNAAEMEKKKQLANAESTYKYVLSLIAKRDGPGSEKAVPVLQKLAKVTKEQKKTDEAISYQKTVVAFMERARTPNPEATVQAQNELTGLFISKQDFAAAEPVAAKSVEIVKQNPQIKPEHRTATLRVYGSLLRQLHKDEQAAEIESLTAEAPPVPVPAVTANAAPPTTVPQELEPPPLVPSSDYDAPVQPAVVAAEEPPPDVPQGLVPPPLVPSSDYEVPVTPQVDDQPQPESATVDDTK